MIAYSNPAKRKLESLFVKTHHATPDAPNTEKTPPMRPCGCRTWFVGKDVCPYCGKRILRAVLEGKFG